MKANAAVVAAVVGGTRAALRRARVLASQAIALRLHVARAAPFACAPMAIVRVVQVVQVVAPVVRAVRAQVASVAIVVRRVQVVPAAQAAVQAVPAAVVPVVRVPSHRSIRMN